MKARAREGSYQRMMQDIARKYMRVHNVISIDPDEVARWAVDRGLWHDRPYDPVKKCKRDLTRALAVQYELDPQGREVRSNVAIPIKGVDGQLQWEWAPIFKTPPQKFRLAQQLKRSRILADCRQHLTDTESWNDNNEHGAVVDLFDYNFNHDLDEERLPTEYPEEDPESD